MEPSSASQGHNAKQNRTEDNVNLNEAPAKTMIFVDGQCVVCDMEIAHYKRLAPQLFDLVDISDSTFEATAFGLSRDAVNFHLHVQTPTGEILKGVEAFAHIWSRLPRYTWASRAIQMPLIYPVAQIGYSLFARVRPWLPRRKKSGAKIADASRHA
jgi:predicted DCC family thiol-disulfide oxidoreductase YuxK